ncbi:uncharacterized protein BDZ83DRAFT_466880 [Colletotrichum acutatum]|uniref:Uncharacterized protein n=1 Tax=Glomerella acutata TaxID=27357 RepID=A0AAD8XBP8_GLOAC|nr:uncharacterized protein BDZ83DRAFT_466880 [Colletotrichum acutatum]KAK1718887.1 hypothetical protein BDZ83DRAFT_466880 [Colletotrichum acutatum]
MEKEKTRAKRGRIRAVSADAKLTTMIPNRGHPHHYLLLLLLFQYTIPHPTTTTFSYNYKHIQHGPLSSFCQLPYAMILVHLAVHLCCPVLNVSFSGSWY